MSAYQKIKKLKFISKRKILYFVSLFYITIVLSVILPSQAQAVCEESSGGGAIFYKFDKIVLYFWKFPHHDVQTQPNYPTELKFENFSNSLQETIKENFASCLKRDLLGKALEDKPIIVTQQLTDEVSEPSSLTVIINVSYRPPLDKTKADKNLAIVQLSLFRSGLSNQDSIRPLLYYNHAEPIFPYAEGMQLQQRLQSVFKMIKPEDFSTEYLRSHPEYRGKK